MTIRRTPIILCFAAVSSGCAHIDQDALARWAAEKAGRFAQCQLLDPTSREQAEACLGEFARDLGTDTCRQVERKLERLPHADSAPE
jgi:predicted TIM-barrel fold metal-dependent hydrolase